MPDFPLSSVNRIGSLTGSLGQTGNWDDTSSTFLTGAPYGSPPRWYADNSIIIDASLGPPFGDVLKIDVTDPGLGTAVITVSLQANQYESGSGSTTYPTENWVTINSITYDTADGIGSAELDLSSGAVIDWGSFYHIRQLYRLHIDVTDDESTCVGTINCRLRDWTGHYEKFRQNPIGAL